MRILILDDDQHNIDSLIDALDSLDFQIDSTTNPEHALDLVQEHHTDYCVLLFDIHMPKFSGFDIAKKIDEMAFDHKPPIIFLTAIHTAIEDVRSGYYHGAVDYLTKPFDLYILTSKIKCFMQMHENHNRSRKLANTLAQKVKELENTNKNLRSFAYIISHDLKAPLRQINGFSDILLEDLQHKNSCLDREEIYDTISRVQQCTDRMRKIIHDINNFSYIGLSQVAKDDVSFKELVDIGKSLLQKDISRHAATINLVQNDSIYCDKEQMVLVVQNILQNSIKYRRPSEPPVVNLSIAKHEQGTLLSFSDNGMGIPADKHEEVFNFMTRLHSEDEIPGTGMGLTICEKIITTHGGRIWVESNQEGSTVFIKLPDDHNPLDIHHLDAYMG